MPQTTTSINACDLAVSLDNSAGTLVDISGSTNSVRMRLSNTLGVAFTFGTRWPIRLECKSDAELTMRGIYSQADTEAVRQLLRWFFTDRGARTLQVDVPSAAGGGDRFTFEVRLENLDVPLDGVEAAPIPVEATMRPTGSFSIAAIAS